MVYIQYVIHTHILTITHPLTNILTYPQTHALILTYPLTHSHTYIYCNRQNSSLQYLKLHSLRL